MKNQERKIEQHQNVCRDAKRLLNLVLRENLFADVEIHYEDRHDNKLTVVFSFTQGESEVGNEKNAVEKVVQT